ncbi:MAG: LemA family protein [Flavobacteriaceae bacterium]|nr:MAG: LemA family protein [Flavobacteriaceae bacterium]
MKKILIPIAIILVVVFAIYKMTVGFNNSAVVLEEDAKTSWSNVESAYQRRADLIPNLVNTVKGYAAHEKETLEGVIKARSEATKTTIDASKLTAANMAQFQKAQQGLTGALSRLLVTVEKYPDLKANKNFLELQSQLEGTENRINVSRNRFNAVVNTYNKHIKTFPNSVMAGWFSFSEMARFKADEASKNAPKVEF